MSGPEYLRRTLKEMDDAVKEMDDTVTNVSPEDLTVEKINSLDRASCQLILLRHQVPIGTKNVQQLRVALINLRAKRLEHKAKAAPPPAPSPKDSNSNDGHGEHKEDTENEGEGNDGPPEEVAINEEKDGDGSSVTVNLGKTSVDPPPIDDSNQSKAPTNRSNDPPGDPPSPPTPSGMSHFDVSAINRTQSNVQSTPGNFVTITDLIRTMDDRDERLATAFTEDLGRVMDAVEALTTKVDSLTHERTASVNPPTARRNIMFDLNGESTGAKTFRGNTIDLTSVNKGDLFRSPPRHNVREGNAEHGGEKEFSKSSWKNVNQGFSKSIDPDGNTDNSSDSNYNPNTNHPTPSPTPSPSRFKARNTAGATPFFGGFGNANSPLNDTLKKDLYEMYLWGKDGVSDVNDVDSSYLSTLGFASERQEDIFHKLQSLMAYYKHPDVNPKYLDSIHKLSELTTEKFVDFYLHLEQDLRRYNIVLIPFDSILPRYDYVGLSLPAVGATRFMAMGQALFSVLERVLPMEDKVIKDCVDALEGMDHNGFRLLMSIMTSAVPGFCPSLTSVPPVWDDVRNVTRMAKLWNLHWRLSAKHGATFTPINRSLLFLKSIQEHSLSGITTSIQGSIQAFAQSMRGVDESAIILPSNLTVAGIVSTINTTQSPVTTSMEFISSRTIDTTSSHLMANNGNLPVTHINIQGAECNATVARSSPGARGGRRYAPKTTEDRRGLKCRACGRKYHVETECREVGKMLCITDWIKELSPQQRQRAKVAYEKFWNSKPTPTVKKYYTDMLERFCQSRNVSEEELTEVYDWEQFCGSDGDDSVERIESASEVDASD